MRKVFCLLLMSTMLLSVGVANDVSANKIAKTEVSKIEKSYADVTGSLEFALSSGFCQDDVYFIETTCYGNYTLPKFEAVYIEVEETPPNLAQGFSYSI